MLRLTLSLEDVEDPSSRLAVTLAGSISDSKEMNEVEVTESMVQSVESRVPAICVNNSQLRSMFSEANNFRFV